MDDGRKEGCSAPSGEPQGERDGGGAPPFVPMKPRVRRWWPTNSSRDRAWWWAAAARRRNNMAAIFAAQSAQDKGSLATLLLQTVIVPGARTDEGRLIEAVALPWFEIIALLQKDPSIAFQLSPEKWEEVIAGAYKKAGFDEVTLTPRSGDHGRDIIAIKKGIGFIRVIDQVKAYTPPHLVTADDVRALIGVLHGDGASKGCLTTTSDFAPKIKADPLIVPFIPSRLELVNGTQLFTRLEELAGRKT
jgi:restriction system protein